LAYLANPEIVMKRTLRYRLISLLALAGLSGCAGYRGGWESFAYIGQNPPANAADIARESAIRPPLALPGLKLEVALDNRLRTYDTQ
jgi:hypothetical protein